MNGGELCPGPSAPIADGRSTTTTNRPQPGMAENCAQGPQPGLARDHPSPSAADPSQELRGTAPRALKQDWRGTTNQHQQQSRAENGRELHPGPFARIGEGPPPTTSKRPQPGRGRNGAHCPQPGRKKDTLKPGPAKPQASPRQARQARAPPAPKNNEKHDHTPSKTPTPAANRNKAQPLDHG